MKAPFPYFGGKSEIASVVWQALGADVINYVEPFAGSLAVLLQRPGGAGKTETVNDADGLLANAWRAMRHAPDEVAQHADWPVNECDLHARHLWLVGQRDSLSERLMAHPDYFCPKSAGWWIWGACAWIGSGWCSGNGPWRNIDGVLTDTRQMPHVGNAGMGINRQMPHVGNAGMGINRKMPHVGNAGMGINRQMPHVGDAGMGINRKMPHVGDAGRGAFIQAYFAKLAARLRDTRVMCGDFERVLGPSVTTRHGMTGVFLDPPYNADNHDPYSVSGADVSRRTREWAFENGQDPNLRIVLAGYDGEHQELELNGWRRHKWKAAGGYGSQGDGRGRDNAGREVLWLSPNCLDLAGINFDLFAQEDDHGT